MRPSIDYGGCEERERLRARDLQERAQRYEELLLDWLRAGTEILCRGSDEIDYDYLAELAARTRPMICAGGGASHSPVPRPRALACDPCADGEVRVAAVPCIALHGCRTFRRSSLPGPLRRHRSCIGWRRARGGARGARHVAGRCCAGRRTS